MVTATEHIRGFRAGSGKAGRLRGHGKNRIRRPASDLLPEPLLDPTSDLRSPGDSSNERCGADDSADNPLSWLPLYCERALRSGVERHELVIFVQTARNDLHRRMDSYFTNYKELQREYFTIEERNALEIADSLKTGELMGNHRTLRAMEKYLKTGVRAHLMRAREHYRNTEDVWSRLIEHLKEFAMINLLGRRCFSF